MKARAAIKPGEFVVNTQGSTHTLFLCLENSWTYVAQFYDVVFANDACKMFNDRCAALNEERLKRGM